MRRCTSRGVYAGVMFHDVVLCVDAMLPYAPLGPP